MATLDGNAVFGYASIVNVSPNPNSQQMNNFFGLDGTQTLYGGTRGYVFKVKGVFVGNSLDDITASETALLSYADGQTHTLADNLGQTFNNVIFTGEYQRFAQGPRGLAGGGWCLPFDCVLHGLTT